jgi:hypothetical protein
MSKDKFYYKDGTTSKYRNNKKTLHRTGGPAAERASGDRQWYVDGKLHRIDGPAVEYSNEDKAWWVDGKLHRLDNPAIVWANGDKEWWVEGKQHRIDGPAAEYATGHKEWWVDDERYTKEDFNKLIKEIKEMSLTMKLIDPREWVRELGKKEVG